MILREPCFRLPGDGGSQNYGCCCGESSDELVHILYPAAALVSLRWKPSILSRVELLTRQPRKNLPVIGSLLPERGRKNGD